MTVLAIIPARGGSKRVPRKNVRDLCGKPMICWTIGAALATECITTAVVFSDDDEILDVARSMGCLTLKEPAEMAQDSSSIYDAIFYVCDALPPHDYTMLLHPTSPLRTAEDIDGCFRTCLLHRAPSCVTVDLSRPVANGAVYVAWSTWLREFKNFDLGRTVTHVMPTERSVDVDTPSDFDRAVSLMARRFAV